MPAEYVFEQITGFTELEPELKSELKGYKNELTRFIEITKEASPEIKQSLFNNINNSISKTMGKWEQLFLYKL